MFIYVITNKKTSKRYVGMTKRTLRARFNSHCYEARVQKYNMYLHNSIRKHGPENFAIELIEECSADIVGEREKFWIVELNTIQPFGYNEHEGGRGGCPNPSVELRKKLSDARKGKPPWNKGLSKHTDNRIAEYARLISISLKGVCKTEEHKKKMRKQKRKRAEALFP